MLTTVEPQLVASSSSIALRCSRHRFSRHRSSDPRSSCSRSARHPSPFLQALNGCPPRVADPLLSAPLAVTAAPLGSRRSLSRDCGSAQIWVGSSSEGTVLAFALAFGAFAALATSSFHDPSFRFVSFLRVLSKNNSSPILDIDRVRHDRGDDSECDRQGATARCAHGDG